MNHYWAFFLVNNYLLEFVGMGQDEEGGGRKC